MFNAQRRTKEIGVRKVLGASVTQVLILLFRDFFGPVMISFLLAFPLAYYLMEQFLEGYAFRIAIPVLTFILVGIATIGFVLLTVSYQSVKTAMKNPVESLKTE
jgi:ABC-type antimicrobial peptide transport system permease subunit